MLHDPSTELYIPVFYVLMQSKKKSAYWYAFNGCIAASGWTLAATITSCDFEQNLISQADEQFTYVDEGTGEKVEGLTCGCFFHHVKDNKEHLLKLKIPKNLIYKLIGSTGVMELLYIIDPAEIEDIGKLENHTSFTYSQ